jgi:nucleoid DNA-binding protein
VATTTKKPSKLAKVSKTYTKPELLKILSERTKLTKKQVGSVLDELKVIMTGHLKKDSVKAFVLPGILRISIKKIPTKKNKLRDKSPNSRRDDIQSKISK